MFIPQNTEMTEHHAIADFLTENAFAVMVSEDLSATHLPLTYVEDEGEKGTSYGGIFCR